MFLFYTPENDYYFPLSAQRAVTIQPDATKPEFEMEQEFGRYISKARFMDVKYGVLSSTFR